MGRLRLAALAAALAVMSVTVGAVPARAVEVDWGRPAASAVYGQQIEFRQPATLPGDIARVEVLVEFPDALGPVVTEVPAPAAGRADLVHTLILSDGHVLPNTELTARWRIVGRDGTKRTGPPVSIRYADTRFDWRTLEGEVVRVHWYDGSDAFGRRALEIGERAIRATADLLGVTEDEPVDFYIYAGVDAFREALGPGTRENVGGQANADLRTLFALITPGEIDDPWVSIVIPHELVHLVFDTAVDNPYHFPPRWLNEGLADYLSQGYDSGYRAAVRRAAGDGTLIPLEGLSAQFPTTRDRFLLAYAESAGAVDFFIRRHGRDAIVQLIRSYAEGLTDDEAFERAIGMDVAAFDAAWREDAGAGDPTEYGPQPAPAGPLPPGWQPADVSPGPSIPPRPGPTAAPGAPLPGDPDGTGTLLPAVGVALVVLAAAGLVLVARASRRRERAEAARWAAWRDDRDAGRAARPAGGSPGDAGRPPEDGAP